jgi:hypothetical protein
VVSGAMAAVQECGEAQAGRSRGNCRLSEKSLPPLPDAVPRKKKKDGKDEEEEEDDDSGDNGGERLWRGLAIA